VMSEEASKIRVTVDPAMVLKAYDDVRRQISELEKRKGDLRDQVEELLRRSPGKKCEAGGFLAEMKRIESEALDREGVIAKFGRKALGKLLTVKRSWRVNVTALEA
jgi:hypothetical protein